MASPHAGTAALALVALLGAGAVGAALPQVDATRGARAIDDALLFVPEPGQLQVASMGFSEPLASLFWIRTVLVFGERYDTEKGARWAEWLDRMVNTVVELDPTWRTPYFYGGSLLRVIGEIDASDRIFGKAREHLPDDWYFPFSLGMNAYLYRDDAAGAARYLEEAAALPGAPGWYPAAAAAMRQRVGDRAAGIRYLEEIAASTDNPAVKADTERQLGRLRHNDLVDSWTDACKAWRDAHGPLSSPEEIRRLGIALPPNPRGDAWIVGSDGVVRSEGAEQERLRDVRGAEFALIGP